MKQILLCAVFAVGLFSTAAAQKLDNSQLRQLVDKFKIDPRGPYKDIRWFCKNGSFVEPKESCPNPGGVQRARYKDEVESLATSNHIFLGQILSTTNKEDFWDKSNYNSRVKQYQLEKYLRSIDDGWVLRKGQYYRGAYQVEDEEAWGLDFFNWLLANDNAIKSQFFLIRQLIKDIPHEGNETKTLSIRALSKNISDSFSAFTDLRVKIHGQPEAADIAKVIAFKENHKAKLSADLQKKLDNLIADMQQVYQPVSPEILNNLVNNLPPEADITTSLKFYISSLSKEENSAFKSMATADKIAEIREEILNVKSPAKRLVLLDISNALEEIFFVENSRWNPKTLHESTEKICYTGMTAMGTGLIEFWEWKELSGYLSLSNEQEVSLKELQNYVEDSRRLIEWGTGMVYGVYKDVVNQYTGFESKSIGFFDDRIRSSVLLPLGNIVGDLGNLVAIESKLANNVMNAPNQSSFRGLNPGYALGELVIVEEDESEMEISNNKIYIFHHPPADLKPVAGIMTVTEGNMVSHVQLLARNLGIPNSVLSSQNLEWLKRYSGQKVFYAVSNRGTVILKPESELSSEEKALFSTTARSEEKIEVPIGRMDLTQKSVLDMREVNAASSGKICGPKAANLGQLKLMFPDKVVEGLVLPFGVFREHMDLKMTGKDVSYWEYLTSVFQKAKEMREGGAEEKEVESYTLKELETLREAIKKIELLPHFIKQLEEGFVSAFESQIGSVPVFVRSDTNMEDLKDFTGAGLNLTLFNVVEREKIFQGIKDVWASPYTERSFKWRQRYLLNPEFVFPSILIIPSVDVEYSGVMITKGIPTNDPQDITIAFSRGAGGAVDGQAAESYLLGKSGRNYLLSPAREAAYRRLPVSGGSKTEFATFQNRILNGQNLNDLRWMAYNIDQELRKSKVADSKGPYDIELGFKENKIWLFQIRPFVENKNALKSAYLESISPNIDETRMISTKAQLN